MGDIKSAREIAMEKISKLGEPTEEERLQWKYNPEGEKLAARYLKNIFDLPAELGKYDKSAARVISKSASAVLIKNINIPKNDNDKKINKIAMDGVKALKADKAGTEAALNQIRHIFNHYSEQGEQQRKQAYAALKNDFQAKLEQALRQQMGGNMSGIRIDIEKQPQFQEEWRKLKLQLDSQYLTLLDEYKQELDAID
jgi:hypothetical protein